MADGQILVPLDGSDLAETALPYAEAIATTRQAEIRLLTAIAPDPDGSGADAQDASGHTRSTRLRDAEQYLHRTAERLRARDLAVSTSLVPGYAAETILAAMERGTAAMIVLATHGLGGLQGAVAGSVADTVMRFSMGQVLVVRPAVEAGPERRITLQRLMTPLDGSLLAECALPVATDLAGMTGASLMLVQVHSLPVAMSPASGESASMQYLTTVGARMPAEVHVQTMSLWGSVAETLRDLAMQQAIDLVVMSMHGRGGRPRFILGSTANHLIRSGVPVLLVPALTDTGGHSQAR